MTRRHILLCTVGLVLLATAPLQADIFIANLEFSTASNPNGPWSYGYRSAVVASDFTAYTDPQHAYPIDVAVGQWYEGWFSSDQLPIVPYIAKNMDAIPRGFGTIPVIQPGQLVLHPGDDASVLRWTAPNAGTVDLLGVFTRLDLTVGLTSEIAVVHNGAALFDSTISGFFDTDAFNSSFAVSSGDSIDFVVGNGGDGYAADSTAVAGIINFTAVPEPTTLASMLLALGTVGIILRIRRRRQAA